jgi:hypothetical protein
MSSGFGPSVAAGPWGGQGSGGVNGGSGNSAQTNSGAGGGAGNSGAHENGGGGAGGYLEKLITSPSATYSYAVGSGGSGGSGTQSGGNGGSGVIIVQEFY